MRIGTPNCLGYSIVHMSDKPVKKILTAFSQLLKKRQYKNEEELYTFENYRIDYSRHFKNVLELILRVDLEGKYSKEAMLSIFYAGAIISSQRYKKKVQTDRAQRRDLLRMNNMKAYEELVFNEVKLASSHLFKDVERVCLTLGTNYKEILNQFNEAVE